MPDLKIVFMGTPYFAVPTLKALIANNYNVVAVVTAPDKPAGRGQKLQLSDVKKEALLHNIPVLQPTNLKSELFLKQLQDLKVNLQIVVAFRMLPKTVWQLPEFGTFNLHASLLPDYRGAAPINWAIINGETKTGVTTFFIDDKIDTGAIIYQNTITITADDTAGTLHDKLMAEGANLVIKTVDAIANNTVETKIQATNSNKIAPKLHPDTCKIKWQNDLISIHNFIRGLNPYPGAWCFLRQNESEIKLKIFKTAVAQENHNLAIGTLVFDKKTIKVACKNGFLRILELQPAGKKKMDAISYLNGQHLKPKDRLI